MDSICLGVKKLVFYRHLLQSKPFQRCVRLLDLLAQKETLAVLVEGYTDLVASLLAEETSEQWGDLWQNYLLDQVIAETSFAVLPELHLLQQELCILQSCFCCNLSRLEQALQENTESVLFPVSYATVKKEKMVRYSASYERKLAACKETFLRCSDWSVQAETLLTFYQQVGTSLFAKYWGFTWHGELLGIRHLELVNLDQFVGYEVQRKQLLDNTEQFVKGLGANNVLLYGDRGTGKSSSIKALFNCYSEQGLRLVELAKHQLVDFPQIIRLLREEPEKFIIFVDDLSFEQDETEYKYMKALLEGGLEVQPKNILIYATSNRRHLIREFASEREKNEELHQQDTIQEKLSLADRFGVTITFTAPTSKEYLQIVDKLAEQRGIHLPQEELHDLALKWQLWHNGLSGRTAKQFIEDLAGKLQL